MLEMYPQIDKSKCACGCGEKLFGRKKRWVSETCQIIAVNKFQIIKGDTSVIRFHLFERDQGACRICGLISDTWQADHIIPVAEGGGGCDLSNFQTLCLCCHKDKTLIQFSTKSSTILN